MSANSNRTLAERVARLRAERDALREAAGKVTCHYCYGAGWRDLWQDGRWQRLPCPDCDDLRAALERQPYEQDSHTQTQVQLAEAERRSWAFGEIMAVLHRDGGHYLAEHGTDKALADAIAKHNEAERERDRAIELLMPHLSHKPKDGKVCSWVWNDYTGPCDCGAVDSALERQPCLARRVSDDTPLPRCDQHPNCPCGGPSPLDDPSNFCDGDEPWELEP